MYNNDAIVKAGDFSPKYFALVATIVNDRRNVDRILFVTGKAEGTFAEKFWIVRINGNGHGLRSGSDPPIRDSAPIALLR